MWIMVHALFLCWSVAFPFGYRQLKLSGRLRHAHIATLLLALIVPLPGPLVHLKDGYVPGNAPALVCIGQNVDVIFYTFILPVSIIVAFAVCLLVIIFWTIFKVLQRDQHLANQYCVK